MDMERRKLLAALGAAVMLAAGCASTPGQQRQQVVLQVSDDNVKTWQTAFNVVNNLTNTYGKRNVDIELVAFGDGINALTFDSKAASRIPGAVGQGARVIACENSMTRFKLSKGDMAPDVIYVRAGVQRIIERQREGWTVIRP
jgi:intracellular sulfur oxidation DsrE/DsrF family protein